MSVMRYLWEESHGGHYSVNGAFEQCPESEVVAASDYDALAAALAIVQDTSIAHAGKQNARIAELESAIKEHNDGCVAICGRTNEYNAKNFGCESYLSRDMQCPNCPMDDLIEVTPSETAAKSDAEEQAARNEQRSQSYALNRGGKL